MQEAALLLSPVAPYAGHMVDSPQPQYSRDGQPGAFRGSWHGHDIYLVREGMEPLYVLARFGGGPDDYVADKSVTVGTASFTASAFGLDFEVDPADPERERFMTEARALAKPTGPWPRDYSRGEDGRVRVNVA